MKNQKSLEKLVYKWIEQKPEEVDVKSDYYCKTRDIFQARLEKMLEDLLKSKVISEDDAYIVSAISGEIGNNSFDHNLESWPDIKRARHFENYEKSKAKS